MYIILSGNNWLTLPVVRHGTARQLPGGANLCHQAITGIMAHMLLVTCFPHAK